MQASLCTLSLSKENLYTIAKIHALLVSNRQQTHPISSKVSCSRKVDLNRRGYC